MIVKAPLQLGKRAKSPQASNHASNPAPPGKLQVEDLVVIWHNFAQPGKREPQKMHHKDNTDRPRGEKNMESCGSNLGFDPAGIE
jgi:hypothetical protein